MNNTNEARPAGEIIRRIQETSASVSPDPALPKPPPSSCADRMKNASASYKAAWLLKRLALKHHHPDLSDLEEKVWRFCQGFAQNPSHGRRLVIYGNNGTGKSRTAKAVRRWVNDMAVSLPLVIREDLEGQAGLADCLLVNWAAQVARFKAGDWDIDDLLTCSMLILDDVGAEHDPSKCGVEKLYLVLERREHKWTLITTNTGPDSWEQRFERRISDRFMRNSTLVDLSRVPSYSANT